MLKRNWVIIFSSLFAFGCAGSGSSPSTANSILHGDISGRYEVMKGVNAPLNEAVSFVELDQKEALQITVKYEWEGGALDWERNGTPGYAQRVQFRENRQSRMQVGREYWYTGRFYIPSTMPTVSNYVISLMDFKHEGPDLSYPSVSLNLQEDGNLNLIESLSSSWLCGTYRNVEGGRSSACDRTESAGVLGPQRQFSGRWVQFVANMKWSRGSDGFFRFWIDGRPVFAFAGNTVQEGEEIQFKFGPYRRQLTPNTPATTVYYAEFARSNSCDELIFVDCGSLSNRTPRLGFQNIRRLDRWTSNELQERKGSAVR